MEGVEVWSLFKKWKPTEVEVALLLAFIFFDCNLKFPQLISSKYKLNFYSNFQILGDSLSRLQRPEAVFHALWRLKSCHNSVLAKLEEETGLPASQRRQFLHRALATLRVVQFRRRLAMSTCLAKYPELRGMSRLFAEILEATTQR